jgi:2-octaprenylphenol hydroxylase
MYDIAIVGAGMVGASLAASLRDTNYSIALIDAQSAESLLARKALPQNVNEYEPRVSALTFASRDLLKAVEAWQRIEPERILPYRNMHVWDQLGTAKIEFDAAELYEDALGYIVENQNIVSALHQALASQENLECFFDTRIAKLSQSQEEGTVNCLELEDGRKIEAKLLVAADGANSRIRTRLSMATREWDYQHQAIVATIKTEKAHQLTAWQCFAESGPLAFLPLKDEQGSNEYCSIVWSQTVDRARSLMDLDDAAFCKQLTEESEAMLGQVKEVSKRFSIPLRQRHAKEYVAPGVALIGDAAHTIHPLAGQGVNLGFKDVVALSEVLKDADQHELNPGLEPILKRYQRQRQADNLLMMGAMEGFKRLFAQPDPLVRWMRNTGLDFVNKQSFIKKQLVKHAMGLSIA